MIDRACPYLGRLPGDERKEEIRASRDQYLASIADDSHEVTGHFAPWVCARCDQIVWVHSELVYGPGVGSTALAQSPGCMLCDREGYARQSEALAQVSAMIARAVA